MSVVNLALWAAGALMVGLAVYSIRMPRERLTELDRIAENARRYEGWRFRRATSAKRDKTGADVMREMLRRRVQVWAAVAVVGVCLVLAGFAIR